MAPIINWDSEVGSGNWQDGHTTLMISDAKPLIITMIRPSITIPPHRWLPQYKQ